MSKKRSKVKVCRQIDTFSSPAAKRVAVARDALAWLRAGALQAETGNYVKPFQELPIYTLDGHKQLRDVVFGETTVCALGALFIAHVVRFDDCTVAEYAHSRLQQRNLIETKMKGTFEPKELELIESAFECGDLTYLSWPKKTVDDAIAFGNRYRSARNRLVAILENIIANEGNFRPPKKGVRQSSRAVAHAHT